MPYASPSNSFSEKSSKTAKRGSSRTKKDLIASGSRELYASAYRVRNISGSNAIPHLPPAIPPPEPDRGFATESIITDWQGRRGPRATRPPGPHFSPGFVARPLLRFPRSPLPVVLTSAALG